MKNPSIAAGLSVSNNVSSTTDIFEDVDPDHVWRWEVATVEILPEACLNQVKKARSARRKFMNHFNATARLLGALDESIKLMSKGMPPRSKVDKVVAKISKEEEKVLKHERDAEKARLAAEAQKKKEENLMKEKKTKEEEKERLKEEKKRQIEEKKREKEEAKRKKALEREEAKRKKEEKEKEEQAKKDREEEKQRKRMMSFFGGPSKKAKTEETSTQMEASEGKFEASNSSTTLVDSDRFWSCLNAGKVDKPPFGQLSRRAKISRKRKSKLVNVKVFVSGASAGPENPFDFQPVFAEEQEIEIRNRNKFLSFTEDLR